MVQSSRLRSDGFIPWLPRHLFPGHPQTCWFSSKMQLYPPHARDTFILPKRLPLGDRETEARIGLWWNDNKKPFLGTSLFRSHHFCLDVQIKPSVAFTSKVLRPKMGWGFHCTLQHVSILSWHGFKSQLSIVCRIVFSPHKWWKWGKGFEQHCQLFAVIRSRLPPPPVQKLHCLNVRLQLHWLTALRLHCSPVQNALYTGIGLGCTGVHWGRL